ncbi:hypothetical protein H4R99_001037 [Coemansia sp. RSA 1722]|nr:hypothetical protein H4R99_001037 [Coemansia sp. RSA 1722]
MVYPRLEFDHSFKNTYEHNDRYVTDWLDQRILYIFDVDEFDIKKTRLYIDEAKYGNIKAIYKLALRHKKLMYNEFVIVRRTDIFPRVNKEEFDAEYPVLCIIVQKEHEKEWSEFCKLYAQGYELDQLSSDEESIYEGSDTISDYSTDFQDWTESEEDSESKDESDA